MVVNKNSNFNNEFEMPAEKTTDNTYTKTYFFNLISEIFSEFSELTLADVVARGFSLATAQKVRHTASQKFDEELIFKYTTDTIIKAAEIVDKVNKKNNLESTYAKDFKKAIKVTLNNFIKQKSFDNVNIAQSQIYKVMRNKEKANYYIRTIVTIADFLNEKT
ncbi:hypothetical protein P9705_001292 [Enterococcus faecalis]|nr:hypothetical protein [Enterococcus faecalis]